MDGRRQAIQVKRSGADVILEIVIRDEGAVRFALMGVVVLGAMIACFIFTVPSPRSSLEIAVTVLAVAFFAVCIWAIWSIFSHGALIRERLEITRPRIMRSESVLGWSRKRETLEFHSAVRIDEGREQYVAQMHREDEPPEVAPHGFTLRSGDQSLWIGRRAWRPDHREALRDALRHALRHHGVWDEDQSKP